jgi:hypothetical protein
MSNQKGFLSALAVLLFVSACGGSKPTPPTYPYPEPTPVEDTELGVYLDDEADEELDEPDEEPGEDAATDE